MNNQTVIKALGIFIFVVMALSMLAFAYIYMGKDTTSSSGTNTSDSFPQATSATYNYTLTFDTNVLTELNAGKFGAMTNYSNKAEIDSAVLKVEGVSKVTSQFKKESFDANSWVYLAELSIKRNYDLSEIAKKIGDLNYFDKVQGWDSMKYVTVAVPSSLMIHNVDLNMDKNFSFPTATISALASSQTKPGDEIVVSGSMQAQGTAILSLQLTEKTNKTQQAQQLAEIMKQLQQDQNKPVDTNTSQQDTNVALNVDLNK